MQIRNYGLIFGSLAYFVLINKHIAAGPTSRRMAREIYPEVEPKSDANQSQECEYNGSKSLNGERVENFTKDDCQVCYCRSGEIKCANVSCYIRNDCQGKEVPGQCCPKYDHCPTKDSLGKVLMSDSSNSSNATFNQDNFGSTSTANHHKYYQTQNNNETKSGITRIQKDNSLQNLNIAFHEIIPNVTEEDPVISNLKLKEPLVSQRSGIFGNTSNNLVVTDSAAQSGKLFGVTHNPSSTIKTSKDLTVAERNESMNTTFVEVEDLEMDELNRDFNNISNSTILIPTSMKPYSTMNDEDYSNDHSSTGSSHIVSFVKNVVKPTRALDSPTYEFASSVFTPAPATEISSSDIFMQFQDSSTSKTAEEISSFTLLPTFELSESSQHTDSTNGEELINIEETLTTFPASNITQLPNMVTVGMVKNVENFTGSEEERIKSGEKWIKMLTDTNFNQTVLTKKQSKILQDILEIRNNKTLPTNISHGAWLKSGLPLNLGALSQLEILNYPLKYDRSPKEEPEEKIYLKETTTGDNGIPTIKIETENNSDDTAVPLDSSIKIIIVTKNTAGANSRNITELVPKESVKSVESIEYSGEYSGETTTPKRKSILPLDSDQNASIEDDRGTSEIDDLLLGNEHTIDLSNDEERKSFTLESSSENITNYHISTDVEIFNTAVIQQNIRTTSKNKYKRENPPSLDGEGDVFAQLNQELGLGSTEKPKTPEEEENEARRIFEELLEETSSPNPQTPLVGETKESGALHKVSQALTKLALGRSQYLDAGVLGVLRDFFSSQYRSYDSKSP